VTSSVCRSVTPRQYTTNYQVVYTAIFISVLPLVILYILFRRWFIQGVMAGAVKG